jgi:hypothetical protein
MGWRTLLCAGLLLIATSSGWSAILWETYSDDRFGTMIERPYDWVGQKPEDGDGFLFTSPDGKATIVVTGALNSLDTVANAFGIYEKPTPGETIMDRHLDKGGITISGKKGGRAFLRRSILSCGNKLWNVVSIEFPVSQQNKLQSLTETVLRSLRFRSSTEVADCRR